MKIVDSAVHIVDEDKPERPWDPNFGKSGGAAMAAARKHFNKDAALTTAPKMLEAMDHAGVDAALLVATSHYGWDNSYSVESAEAAPERFRVIGRINHTDEDVSDQIAAWKKNQMGVGLRLLFLSDQTITEFNAGYFDLFLRAAKDHDMPVCIFSPGYLREVASIARRYPDLPIVIDHLGSPQPPLMEVGDDPFAPLKDLRRLSRFENVSVKLSAVPSLSAESFPFMDLWPHLETVIEAFGVDRLMWGSDWTRVAELYSYEEGVRYMKDAVQLSDDEKEKIMGGNLRRIFGWALV